MKRTIIIKDLPPRARKLDEQDLAGVFGGCVQRKGVCVKHEDCCKGKCRGRVRVVFGPLAVIGGVEGSLEDKHLRGRCRRY